MPIWIETSCRFLPKTSMMIRNIELISAKKEYKDKSNNIMDWKMMAFYDLMMENNYIKNVVSIGDAEYEYRALLGLRRTYRNILLKSVKLIDKPSIEIILDQLNVLKNTAANICVSKRHIDLKFKKIDK